MRTTPPSAAAAVVVAAQGPRRHRQQGVAPRCRRCHALPHAPRTPSTAAPKRAARRSTAGHSAS